MWLVCTNAIWKKKKEEHLPNHRHDTHKNKGRTLNCFLLQKPSAFFPFFFLNVILHLSVHLTPLHRLPLPLPSSLLPLFPRWKQMATTTASSFLSIHGRTETHPSPFVVDERKIFFVLFVRLPMPFQAVWSISFFCLFSTRLPMDCLYYTHRKRGRQRKQKKKREKKEREHIHTDTFGFHPPFLHTLLRFQSAIWLSMMRWLEREMIACEAIRETGTNGLVYTTILLCSATVQSQQTPAEDRLCM